MAVTVFTPCVALKAVIGLPYWASIVGITTISVAFTVMVRNIKIFSYVHRYINISQISIYSFIKQKFSIWQITFINILFKDE